MSSSARSDLQRAATWAVKNGFKQPRDSSSHDVSSRSRYEMTTQVFSKLRLPWPTRRNKLFDRYQRAAKDVLVGIGLVADDLEHRTAMMRFEGVVLLDSYVYPYAKLEPLLAAGAFSQWLFFLDDQYDDHPDLGRDPSSVRAIMEHSFAVLSTGYLPSNPTAFDRFTVYLKRRLDTLSSDEWMRRFMSDIENYLFRGSLPAIEHWAQDETPTLDQYLTMRMYDSAVFAAIDIIEVAAGIELTDEIRNHPVISEMARLTVRHTAYTNDLFSYQKEVLWSGTPCNLVHVLMSSRGSSFEEAVLEVVKIANADVARFLELEANIPSWGPATDEAVRAYVMGMKTWMRGAVDFSFASLRYRAPDSPFLELRSTPRAALIDELLLGLG